MPLIEPGTKAPAFSSQGPGRQHAPARRLRRASRSSSTSTRKTTRRAAPRKRARSATTCPRFKTNKAVVLGVSILDEASKGRFAGKYDLNFPLLADAIMTVADKYGAWQQRLALRPQVHGRLANDLSDRHGRQGGAGDGTTSRSTSTWTRCWRQSMRCERRSQDLPARRRRSVRRNPNSVMTRPRACLAHLVAVPALRVSRSQCSPARLTMAARSSVSR